MSGKRVLSTPGKVRTPKKVCVYSPQRHVKDIYSRDHAAEMLRSGRITRSLEYLFRNNTSAHTSIINISLASLTSELDSLVKEKNSIFGQSLSKNVISEFSWTESVQEARVRAPILVEMLLRLMPYTDAKKKGRRGAKRRLSEEESAWQQNGRVGLILSMMLYNANPMIFKLIPTVLGAQVWRQGGKQKLFNILNMLGLAAGVKGSRHAIDILANESSRDIMKWKVQLEMAHGGIERGARRRLGFGPKLVDKTNPGYAITLDNVQINITPKKGGGTEQPITFKLWAMKLAMLNRISFHNLPDSPESRINASDVPIMSVLPSYGDNLVLWNRMVSVCIRILVDNIPAFNDTEVSRETTHQYSEQMRFRSHMVNLGVTEANPSSTGGTCEILDTMLSYIPLDENGAAYVIPCHGDGLTVDRIIRAKRARANHPAELHRFEGFEPVPQEFHKEMLLMQDNQDKLFTGRSAAARGTRFELKNTFNHRKVKAKVSDVPEHQYQFDKFVTVSYATNLAMQLCGMVTLEDIPVDMPEDEQHQYAWLVNLATIMVSSVWRQFEPHEIRVVAEAKEDANIGRRVPFTYCKCGEDTGEDMVQCSAASCPRNWYHLSCVNLDSAPEGDYWCSRRCQRSGSYIHCFCRRSLGADADNSMVQCERGDECLRSESGWFHQSCLLTQMDDIADVWFCSMECELGTDGGDDGVLEYSRIVLFEGLRQLAIRDMVREGDGSAMLSMWRLDLPKFWNGHPNYFLITHQFLTGVAGYYTPRLAMDVTWNRTVNIHGCFGKNIPHDLINEYVNGDFKELLKNARGRYTDEHVKRCSLIGGPVGQTLDRLLERVVVESKAVRNHTDVLDTMYHSDVPQFIEEYAEEELWSFVPGRFHRGHEQIDSKWALKNSVGMGRRIRVLATDMDDWRQFGVQ